MSAVSTRAYALVAWLCVAMSSACGGSYNYSDEPQLILSERHRRASPDAIESALPPPESRGCVYGTVSTTEAIPTPIPNVDVKSFHSGQLVLRGRSDTSGAFHTCIGPHASEHPWQKNDVNLRIEIQHPGYTPLTLYRTWSIKNPLKLRIFLRRAATAPLSPPSQTN